MPTVDQLNRDAHAHWNDAAALSRLGRELQARNRQEDARRVLTRAVELNPRDADAWAELAYAELRAFREKDGIETMRKGISATGSPVLKAALMSFTPDSSEAERLGRELEGNTEPAVEATRLGLQFRKAEDKRPVLEALRSLHAEHPDDPEVQDYLLWFLIGAKRGGLLADTDIRGVGGPIAEARIASDPDRVSGYLFLLQLHAAQGDWDGVLHATSRALDRMPDEETVMQYRGRAYREKGDVDRAAHWLSRAIGAKPSFAGARVDLGKIYEKAGNTALAEEVFREIPRANPAYPLGPIELACFLARNGQGKEAEGLFLKAWPGVPPYYRRALQQNPDAALLLAREHVRKAIEE